MGAEANQDPESVATDRHSSSTWCTCAPAPAQLALFDGCPSELGLQRHWPLVATSYCARFGFWRQRTPAVFGARRGVGPLIICPDTNILISLYENLDAVEDGIGLAAVPLVASDWLSAVGALRDLVGLWWWRDVRFWVDRDLHLGDGRTPIRPDRLRAREIAVEQLQQDFFERGSWEPRLSDDVPSDALACALHPDDARPSFDTRQPIPVLPLRSLDGGLVHAAVDAGAHVFLTEDREILRCHATLSKHGLTILRPREILEALDATGELEPVNSAFGPAPDLGTLSRFYSLRSPADAARTDHPALPSRPL